MTPVKELRRKIYQDEIRDYGGERLLEPAQFVWDVIGGVVWPFQFAIEGEIAREDE